MRIQLKKTPHIKILVALASVAIVIVTGIFAYIHLSSNEQRSPEPPKAQTLDTPDSSTATNPDNPANTPSEAKKKDDPVQYEGSDPNNSASLTGVINYKAVNEDGLTLRVTIDQALGNGTCTLKLTSAGRVVTRTANVAQNPSSSTCEGFSIPVSELGNGQWEIEVTVTSDDRTGILKDSITI